MTQVFLTTASSSPWSVPAGFKVAGHTVELIGSGGTGTIPTVFGVSSRAGTGGGGGGYSRLTYSSGTVTPGTTTIPFFVAAGGSGNGTGTIWEATTFVNAYRANSGDNGTVPASATGGAGGSGNQTNGSPTIVYTTAGFNGGTGGGVPTAAVGGGGGGGGAAGNDSAGGTGFTTASTAGGGGGGGNNGTAGNAPGQTGGKGSTGNPGVAGNPGTAGTGSSGGGGSNTVSTAITTTGGVGGSGADFDPTHGSGGGGGGSGSNSGNVVAANIGGGGGSFGGGGGGSGSIRGTVGTTAAGVGAPGLIVINDWPQEVGLGWLAPPQVPLKPGVKAQNQQFFAFNPFPLPNPIPFTSTHWLEPAKPKPYTVAKQEYENDWVASYPDIPWFAPLWEPVKARIAPTLAVALIASGLFSPVVQPPSETITVDKWHQRLSEPVRVKQQPTMAMTTIGRPPIIPTRSPVHWLEPPKPKPYTVAKQEYENDWIAVAVDIPWFKPLNEPVRRRPAALQAHYLPWSQPTAAPLGIMPLVQWQEPPKAKPYIVAKQEYENYWIAVTTTDLPNIGWLNNLSDGIRDRPLGIYDFDGEFPVIIPSMDWLVPLSEPRRKLNPVQTAQPTWFTTTTVSLGWYQPLSTPTRRVSTYRPDEAAVFLPAAPFGWFESLSDPVRRRGIQASLQAQFQYPFPTPAVTVGWFNNLSDPTRRTGLATATQDDGEFVAVTTTIDWFSALSEPLPDPLKKRLRPTQVDYQYPFPTPAFTSIAWQVAWSEPVRRKPTAASPETTNSLLPIIPSYGWYVRLSEPTRPKGPSAALQAQFQSPLPPPTVTVSLDWFVALGDPTRRKPTTASPETTTSLFPFVPSYGWYVRLNEPVRTKPRATVFAETTRSLLPIIPSYGWFRPLDNPTLPKGRVSDPPWQSFTHNPIIPSYGWYGPLTEPVRIKPKVWEGIYEARYIGPQIIVTHYATMAAYESRDFFLGVLYTFSPPLHAYVSIIERDPRDMGDVAIIAPNQQPGIIEAVRARVAIIVS